MEMNLRRAIDMRFARLGQPVPEEIVAALQLGQLVRGGSALIQLLQQSGTRATESVRAAQDLLAGAETRDINYVQVSDALLYMSLVDNGRAYNTSNFVTALREHRAGKRLDWQDIVGSFDRPDLPITKPQFLALYNALLPLALDSENFDIQLLWGGKWTNKDTQIYFVLAFLLCTHEELDITRIPRLRKAFTLEDFQESSDAVKEFAASVEHHPLTSLDATAALFNIIFESRDIYDRAQQLGIPEMVINANTQVFLVAAAAVPKPWGGLQDQALRQLLSQFVEKSVPHYDFVLDGLWKRDSQWLAEKLTDLYMERQSLLVPIFEHAQAHGWLSALVSMNTEMSLDLAAYAHGRDALDIEGWAARTMPTIPEVLPKALQAFLTNKADNETQYRIQRERFPPQTVPLTVKSVHALLNILGGNLPEEDMLQLQRACLAAYPRLINYGEGFDTIIDTNGQSGNGIPPDVEARMTEYFKRLYRGELEVREYVQDLQRYKTSETPEEQDLFTSMISGLFEEYNCFGEYPLEALATTAVLFGGIISFSLLGRIALQAALAMVLEAVQEHPIEDSMYKFGLQALIQFIGRLEEWPTFCDRLLRVPTLKGTEIWPKVEEIAKRAQDGQTNGDQLPLTNGNIDALMAAEPAVARFTCVSADPPLRPDLYEEPEEEIQDKVLFVLNNISERNLQDKFKDLQSTLEEKHHQWFAAYLVEERAKSQPNFQPLYLEMLKLFNNRTLWTEVLRETYVIITRMLNAEATLNSSAERNSLKNLGLWLGSLTLARDKPIKFKNVSFKDLLIEGHDSQRLTIAIPFTCKTLGQAATSHVFRPPNPWTVEIIRVLIELYRFGEIKLNLKFEIEVLCKSFGLDHTAIEASDNIRSRPIEDDFLSNMMSEGLNAADFSDFSLMGLNRAGRGPSERFQQNAFIEALPGFLGTLNYPPSSSRLIPEATLQRILWTAASQAITEIISPVVERSVTIAAISAAQLVTKDFAREPDADKFKDCAENVVKALSGSLALVTCKEPLRMSISNNIRELAREAPENAIPEGLILMFINDNLDAICNLIERAAETQSIREIEVQIEEGMHARQRFRDNRTSASYEFPSVGPWASYIPEPYKQQLGGLNQDQLSIYEDFGRQIRGGPPLHGPTPSQDGGRQVLDIIQDAQLPAIPNLPTPAEAPAIPRQPPAQQTQRRLEQHVDLAGNLHQTHMNGFIADPAERAADLYDQLRNAAREADVSHIKDLEPNSAIHQAYAQLDVLLDRMLAPQREQLSNQLAQAAFITMYAPEENIGSLEMEVLGSIVVLSCQQSVDATKAIVGILNQLEFSDGIFKLQATLALIHLDFIDVRRVDDAIARSLSSPDQEVARKAAEFLTGLSAELLGEHGAVAFRSDFAHSFETLTQLLEANPDFELGKSAATKMQLTQEPELPLSPEHSTQDQLEYVFEEWVRLQRVASVSDKIVAAFIRQLHEHEILDSREESMVFLRTCIDLSITSWEQELVASGNHEAAYMHVDALAKLIVALVVYQSESDGAVKQSKPAYLDSILALTVLVMCHHHQHSEHFPQKVFYRLFAGIITEIQSSRTALAGLEENMMLVLGRAFLAMQPRFLPGFAFGWVTLISHRMFMPAMLKLADDAGWNVYLQLTEQLLKYVGQLIKPVNVNAIARDLYRAVLRILLVLHHDFPEFLAENHVRLCDAIPAHCAQLRNLVISAYPSAYPELPDPFSSRLDADRFEDMRKAPTSRYDFNEELELAGIKTLLETLLTQTEPDAALVTKIADVCNASSKHNVGFSSVPLETDHVLMSAVALAIGARGAEAAVKGSGAIYQPSSIHAKSMIMLALQLRPEARYHLISAIVNQLRYPNSHTQWFSQALLAFFVPASGHDETISEIQQQITRVLLERLLVHRPHPWGLIITLLELLKNQDLGFSQLPFVKSDPAVSQPVSLHLLNLANCMKRSKVSLAHCSPIFTQALVLLAKPSNGLG